MHEQVVERHPDWDNRLELAYISRLALRTFRSQHSTIGIISPGEPFHLARAGADWLISWYPLRKDGVALAGPTIESLIDPISVDEYLRSVHEHIEGYRRLVKEAPDKQLLSYIVLTVARGAFTLTHGRPASKRKAAAWAKKRYPEWSDLIEKAWRRRANPRSDRLSTEQTRSEVTAFVNDTLSRHLK